MDTAVRRRVTAFCRHHGITVLHTRPDHGRYRRATYITVGVDAYLTMPYDPDAVDFFVRNIQCFLLMHGVPAVYLPDPMVPEICALQLTASWVAHFYTTGPMHPEWYATWDALYAERVARYLTNADREWMWRECERRLYGDRQP